MKRFALLISVLAAAGALLAPGASARMIELGSQADDVPLSCPGTTESPCVSAVRMTGYQGRASGGPKNPFYIRRDGHLIAFTLRLAKPTPEEIKFFEDNFGTPSTARISVLRRGTTRKHRLDHRLIAQSDTFELDRYFGSKPTFVFDKPIPVKKGNWIAITVPTWAPILATNVAHTNWWRSSRPKDSCLPPKSLRQFAMETLRQVNQFGCTYSGANAARLLYTVTYVPSNHITNPSG
ncbi:MAG TPA: hypothetical protein VM824_04040 [Thermoleophilaceae bacterium]|jgi:hypothetical protein|nr:hypothetical protein [Thermoleophilaceae bacterium]